jgi:creatinine amidohydrolase
MIGGSPVPHEIEWGRMTAEALRRSAEAGAIVIVPVASIEQHGPHMPTVTDTLLAGEVARRAAAKVHDRQPVVVTPTVWSGLSEHHMAFGGTLTLDFATFHALLRGIARSIVRDGFRRVLLLNGHGGNTAALRTIVDELTFELEGRFATCTYWDAAADAFARILERQTNVRHAGEAEASMVMALSPDLVDRSRLAEAAAGQSPRPSVLAIGAFHRWQSFAERSRSGALGDATVASAEKGERLLDAAASAVADAMLDGDLWQASGAGEA